MTRAADPAELYSPAVGACRKIRDLPSAGYLRNHPFFQKQMLERRSTGRQTAVQQTNLGAESDLPTRRSRRVDRQSDGGMLRLRSHRSWRFFPMPSGARDATRNRHDESTGEIRALRLLRHSSVCRATVYRRKSVGQFLAGATREVFPRAELPPPPTRQFLGLPASRSPDQRRAHRHSRKERSS